MDPIIDLKKEDSENSSENTELHWSAEEYRGHKKSREWFFAFSIIAAGIIIFSLILGNPLFAIIILLATALLFMYEVREPKVYTFSITKEGLQTHRRLFEFIHLKSFWIIERKNGTREVLIESKKPLVPHLKIPLGNLDPEETRKTLLQHLSEEEIEESLIDIVAERLGL